MITIAEAIKSINPNAEFVYTEEDINTIEWHNGTTPISVSDIEEKQSELQTEYDNNKYQRDRIYPSIQEQLDMQYWDLVNDTTTWKDKITQIKTDNPKE